jgi:TPR repeat protein
MGLCLAVLAAVLLVGAQGLCQDTANTLVETVRKADQGDPRAQYSLGIMYTVGDGAPKDLPEAARWYRMAALQGHADAQYALGRMHASGEGVTRDLDEAAKWYARAAAQNHPDATDALRELSQ